MRRFARVPRNRARTASAAVFLTLIASVASPGHASPPTDHVLHGVDTHLCPFTIEVTVSRRVRTGRARGHAVTLTGPTTVRVRNASTGRVAVLRATGTASLDTVTRSVRSTGGRLWLTPESHLPFLFTDGRATQLAPTFTLAAQGPPPRVVDPCALVSAAKPVATAATGPPPWPLPAFALTEIAFAGLIPIVAPLVRHDHVHLDLIVDGRRIAVPAGVGEVEPFDVGPGPCPPPPANRTIGDCASGHFFTGNVAIAPLHTHTTSGIVHIESDRPGVFTLGQLFDEWGVRFDATCLGGYCSTAGRELRVYVDGGRISGDPRRLVLRDRQEIAVVYGRKDAFHTVPSSYDGPWPHGCGGPGERACLDS